MTLISRIIRSYFFIGITLYLIIFFYWLDSVNYYNILNVAALLSYAYLLWACINKDDNYFTERRLWLTVFLYSMVMVALCLQMSFFYVGNTFLFSEVDAKVYSRMADKLKDMEAWNALGYIARVWGYDDWGAPVTMAFMLKIVPHKFFVNFCYIIMNSTASLCLFSIGRTLKMTRKYSYMAALAYGTASYTIFFMGSFLKEEILCFLVIVSFYMLYKYHENGHLPYLAAGGLASLLIVFFRVPIALFVWLSYASLLLLGYKGHIRRMLFILLFAVVGVSAAGLMLYSSARYANNGDVAGSYQYMTTTVFQKAVSSLGALIGPFPTLFQVTTVNFTAKPLFGAGVLFKFLLFFTFWRGFVYCLKARIVEAYPLFVFALLEMIGLCIVFDGLELRKAMPHIAIFIMAAFWYMDRFDRDATPEIRSTRYYYWTYRGVTASTIIAAFMTLVWNVLLRIPGVQHIIMFSTDQ